MKYFMIQLLEIHLLKNACLEALKLELKERQERRSVIDSLYIYNGKKLMDLLEELSFLMH